jgi:putative transposase
MTRYKEKYRIESTRLAHWDYRSRGWYFVTICTYQRKHLFGKVERGEVQLSQVGRIAESELESLSTHYSNVSVEEHVVMPNHVHAIIMIDGTHCFSPSVTTNLSLDDHGVPQRGSLSAIVRSYKAGVTRRCHESGLDQAIWQSLFHDHLLRGDKVIAAVREYIRNNPANWQQDKENHL